MEKVIKILGTGCPKCKQTEKLVREVIAQEGIEASVEKVEDIVDIMQYDVMSTPAIVIDEVVVHSGSLPTKEKLKEILANN